MRMHHFISVLVLALALPLSASAAKTARKAPIKNTETTAIDETPKTIAMPSLRTEALQENLINDSQKKSIRTDARIEGMLSLKDPHENVQERGWLYFLQFSLQSFQPAGRAETDFHYTFDLSNNSHTAMPALFFGFENNLFKTDRMTLRWGLGARFGYTSQNAKVVFPSGYSESDARLNTLVLSAAPYVMLSLPSLPSWGFKLGGEFGTLSYTQTSSNDLATFSKQASYRAFVLGLNYSLSKAWGLTFDYSQRKLTDAQQTIAIQRDNFELGSRLIW